MKISLVLASLLLVACAPPPKSALPASVAAAGAQDLISRDTAGIVGIQIGHRIAAFIFFSDHGKVRPVGADECAKAEGCQAMVQKFGEADKTILLHFEPSKPDDADGPDASLHVRPDPQTDDRTVIFLPEVGAYLGRDVQGHQPASAGNAAACQQAGGIPNFVDELYLNCYPAVR